MKNTLLPVLLLFVCAFGYAETCPKTFLKQEGDVQIMIKGPDSGECFKFKLGNEVITPDFTSVLVFNIEGEKYRVNDSLYAIQSTIIMSDGAEFSKRIALGDMFKSHEFVIHKKKKGKYKLKRLLSRMELTDEALAERKEAQKKQQDELMAEHNRRAEEMKNEVEQQSSELKAEVEEMQNKVKEDAEKSKQSAEDFAEESQKKYEADKKRREEEREREDAEWRAKQDEIHNGVREKKTDFGEGAQLSDEAKAATGKEGAVYEPKEGMGSQEKKEDDSFSSAQTEEANGGKAAILNPTGQSVTLEMLLLYEGEPVKDVYLTLKINDIELGSGTTDSNGLVTLRTNKPVDMNTAFKLSGKKGNRTWSFGGIQMLNYPPKVTPVEMAEIIRIVSERSDISEDALRTAWGF